MTGGSQGEEVSQPGRTDTRCLSWTTDKTAAAAEADAFRSILEIVGTQYLYSGGLRRPVAFNLNSKRANGVAPLFQNKE